MRKSVLISGRDPEEFAEAYSKTYASLSHCENFDERFLTNTSMYLFYDDPRKVKKLSPACPMFNMYFGRGDRK